MRAPKSQRRIRLILLIGFVLTTSAGVALQHRIITLEAQGQHPYRLLYLPSKEYVKPAALGYDHTLADFLFLRAIQAFGATYTFSLDLSQLWAYFDTVTELDPHFLTPYSFGNLVLGEFARDDERALAILDKGIANNPEKYKPAYDGAFYALWVLENVELAREYVRTALQTPDCPEFVRRWEAFLDEKMGRYEAAFQKFLTEYLQAVDSDDPMMADIQHKRLRHSIDQWCINVIRDKAVEFEEREGRYPTVQELEALGAFLDVSLPDWPRLQGYLASVARGDLQIEVSAETSAELADRFVRDGWQKLPPSPMSPNRHFPGYIIWPGKEPFYEDGEPTLHFVKNEFEAAFMVKEYLRIAEWTIARYQEEHDGACPPDLATAFPAPAGTTDAFGGEFRLDRERCRVYVTSRPNLREEVGNDRPMN